VALIFVYLDQTLLAPARSSAALEPLKQRYGHWVPRPFSGWALPDRFCQTLSFFFVFDSFSNNRWHRAQTPVPKAVAQHRFHNQEQMVSTSRPASLPFTEGDCSRDSHLSACRSFSTFKPGHRSLVWTSVTLWGYWIHMKTFEFHLGSGGAMDLRAAISSPAITARIRQS
jgi:hypothetical protein